MLKHGSSLNNPARSLVEKSDCVFVSPGFLKVFASQFWSQKKPDIIPSNTGNFPAKDNTKKIWKTLGDKTSKKLKIKP